MHSNKMAPAKPGAVQGLDTDPTARRPRDQQIVLLNSKEVVREFLPVQGCTDQGQRLQVFGDMGDMFW